MYLANNSSFNIRRLRRQGLSATVANPSFHMVCNINNKVIGLLENMRLKLPERIGHIEEMLL
jgi:hypothetical protein